MQKPTLINNSSTKFLKLTIVHEGSRVQVYTQGEKKPKKVLKLLFKK